MAPWEISTQNVGVVNVCMHPLVSSQTLSSSLPNGGVTAEPPGSSSMNSPIRLHAWSQVAPILCEGSFTSVDINLFVFLIPVTSRLYLIMADELTAGCVPSPWSSPFRARGRSPVSTLTKKRTKDSARLMRAYFFVISFAGEMLTSLRHATPRCT